MVIKILCNDISITLCNKYEVVKRITISFDDEKI